MGLNWELPFIIKFEMSQTPTQCQPLQLVRFKDDRFQIPEEAQQFLKNLKKPLAVVTIVGKYRTGKSLFLNKVLIRNPSAFKVCPTINSCTKGLWMWRESLKSQSGEDADVIVVDSEGFGAMEETNAYNNKILLLALLLSSYFIYNSVGSIDENSLNNLNVIANLAKDIQTKNSKDEKIDEQFPSFLWVVRDFTLNLVDKNGCPIQSKEYLEQALQIQKGTSDSIENKNKIRRMVKHFFKDRDCFTMVRPVENEEQLQNLSTLADYQIRPEFIEQIGNLRFKILKKARAKRIKNKPLDGELLLQLALSYVDAINSGSLPNFEHSFKHLMKVQKEKTLKLVLTETQQKVEVQTLKMMTAAQLNALKQELFETAAATLKQKIVETNDLNQSILHAKQEIIFMISRLERENKVKCETQFKQEFKLLLDSNPSGDIQNFSELDSYAVRVKEQMLNIFKVIPLDQSFGWCCFEQWRNQQFSEFAKQLEENLLRMKEEAKTVKESLAAQLKEEKQKHGELAGQIPPLHRDILHLTSKVGEVERLRAVQVQNLERNLTRVSENLERMEEKFEKAQSENAEYKMSLLETRGKVEDFTRENRRLNEEKSYFQKELESAKATLKDKELEIISLRAQRNGLAIQLEHTLQREKCAEIRFQEQLQKQTDNIKEMTGKQSESQREMSELNRQLTRMQAEMEGQSAMISKEKSILDKMFQSFRENLRSQNQAKQILLGANENLSATLKSMEKRADQFEEREKILKDFKKCVKNCSSLQCLHCDKFFVPSIFLNHLNICSFDPLKNTRSDLQTATPPVTTITIKQTLVKQAEGKPFTEYIIEAKRDSRVWSVSRRYKQICELNTSLKSALPGVVLSEVGYIANPQEGSKKVMSIEERRRLLERYLGDLATNPFVYRTQLWKEFIQQKDQEDEESGNATNALQESTNRLNHGKQTPEEFLKMWSERNMRVKLSSVSKKPKGVQ